MYDANRAMYGGTRVADDLLLDPQTFVAERFRSREKLTNEARIDRRVGETLRDCDAAGDITYCHMTP
jgi:hypothetical protein